MSHWWSSKQELILVQIWVVLILSHLVYALRERIATASGCDPFEVSVPLLVELLSWLGRSSACQLEQLMQSGRESGLLRASPRLALNVPQVELSCYQPVPLDLPRQRPRRAPSAPCKRAPKPDKLCVVISCSAEASSLQTSQGDPSRPSQSCSGANGSHLIDF